jgi:hypothetical protein
MTDGVEDDRRPSRGYGREAESLSEPPQDEGAHDHAYRQAMGPLEGFTLVRVV